MEGSFDKWGLTHSAVVDEESRLRETGIPLDWKLALLLTPREYLALQYGYPLLVENTLLSEDRSKEHVEAELERRFEWLQSYCERESVDINKFKQWKIGRGYQEMGSNLQALYAMENKPSKNKNTSSLAQFT